MQNSKHYSNAPLTEAIIDLKVTLPDSVNIDTLASIHPHIKELFPTIEEIHRSAITLQPDLEAPTRLRSSNKRYQTNIRILISK